jgi:hypothetical protein
MKWKPTVDVILGVKADTTLEDIKRVLERIDAENVVVESESRILARVQESKVWELRLVSYTFVKAKKKT